jgi:hypothetical protein
MCLSAWVYRRGEAEWPQLLDDIAHVVVEVVEVTTDDDRSHGVLSDNISDNFSDSDDPVLQVLLFSRLKITVENLDVSVAELQLSPTEESPECLHYLKLDVGSRSIFASTTSSLQGLEGSEPIEVERGP